MNDPAKVLIPVAVLGATIAIGVLTQHDDTKQTPFLAPKEIPGSINHNVTQRSIGRTICITGYTKGIRPPSSYTTALKIKQIEKYDLPGTTKDYEEDHLIPLELGGHPTDPKNLWPEPHPRSFVVDKIENQLHREVCNSKLKLRIARKEIRRIKHEQG